MGSIFPTGLAIGDAFYDRVDERKTLRGNITSGIHTVLVAPRRFGKTSLIKKTLDETKTLNIWLDFMAITSSEEAQNRFLSHISEIIVKIANTEGKLKKSIAKYFSQFKPEISIGIPGVAKVTFKPENIAHIGITEALVKLDMLAHDSKVRVAIVCDEFQEVCNIDKDSVLQASIRHAAERAQSITYIFSGSKHKPLQRLFNGKQSPLYELCDQMTISRVSEADYRKYFEEEAVKKWGKQLDEKVLISIFNYTEYYPKYVNALCAKLWMNEEAPTPEIVDTIWKNYIFSRKGSISEEIGSLTLNQRKLFRYLCSNPTDSPFSYDSSVGAGMPVSAIQVGIQVLQERDLVVEVDDFYRVLDPTYKMYFEMF